MTTTEHSVRPSVGQVFILLGHWCNTRGDGDNATDAVAGTDTNKDNVVLWIGTEFGNFYCLDNKDS
jgi:hypothetical protein